MSAWYLEYNIYLISDDIYQKLQQLSKWCCSVTIEAAMFQTYSTCVVCYSQCKKWQNQVLNLTNGFLCLFDGVVQLILEIFL